MRAVFDLINFYSCTEEYARCYAAQTYLNENGVEHVVAVATGAAEPLVCTRRVIVRWSTLPGLASMRIDTMIHGPCQAKNSADQYNDVSTDGTAIAFS